jgi:uncharacterized membrane protein required for colicin V production
MFMHFIHSLNWVDIVVLGLAIRIIFIGMQTGIMSEFMKVLGLIVALFVSFQYYIIVGGFIKLGGKIPDGFFIAAGFLVIWGVVTVVFKFLRQGLFALFTVQTITALDKWGGVLLAVGRFILTASMVMFVFLVTGNEYLQTKTADAFSRPYFVDVAPRLYKGLSDKFVSRVAPDLKYNSAVRDTLKVLE